MTDYQKYIIALRKCAKEHINDRTSTGHIIVSDLCRYTANLLEELEQEQDYDCISRQAVLDIAKSSKSNWIDNSILFKRVSVLPPVTPKTKTGHCPLKSIDDIKAEIEQQLFKNSQVMTNQDARDMSIYNNALLDALEIIDKYCGKENTDESY